MTMPTDCEKRSLLVALAGALSLLALPWRGANGAGAELIAQPEMRDDAAFIGRAFDMRQRALASGDQGYGAVVVGDGLILGQSASHVVLHRDPTAHAEMEAIRDAARRLDSRDLSRCTLYSSSPARPMCEAAAYWAGIGRLVYGRTARDGGSPRLCG